MEKFTYRGFARLGVLYLQLGGILALLFTSGIAVLLLVLAIPRGQDYSGAYCMAGWFLVVGWIVGFALTNAYPTVWLGEGGLMVSTFPFGRVLVPWAEVVDVGAGRIPFRRGDLVRTRRLTPLHRVYGLLYARSLLPGFIVGREIDDRQRLLHEIRRGISMAQQH